MTAGRAALLLSAALALSGCSADPSPEVATDTRSARCAGQIMSLYYGEALAVDSAAGADAPSMRVTARLLDPGVPSTAGPAYRSSSPPAAPPQGRADAVAAHARTTACDE